MVRRPKEELAVYACELAAAADDLLSNSLLSASEIAAGNTYKASVMNVQIIGESLRAIREHHAGWYAQHETADWSEIVEERHTISHWFSAFTPRALVRMMSTGQISRIRDQLIAAVENDD